MLAKAVANDAAAVPAMAALKWHLGSAKALGIDELTGSIEAGKYADLQAVRMSELTQSPLYDPASQLVYTDSSRYTEYVWVAGKALLSRGELTSIDASQILEKARQWQSKIQP